MVIGVPKEVKAHETRVGLVPSAAAALVEAGHTVVVETKAGEGSTLFDEDYEQVGARILPNASDVWTEAELVVKVKEPQPSEYQYFRPGLTLFTYLHLAPLPELTDKLVRSGVNGIAYETIVERDGSLPLLTPMSEVAGRMSVQVGAQYLERPNGGRGILLGGVPGVAPANVVILGGGVVGTNAARIALGMGAHVTIIDRNLNRLRELDDIFNGMVVTLASNRFTIAESLRRGRAQTGAPRHDLDHEARVRGGRCRHRPGRLLRNFARHHPYQPDLFRGQRAALLRLQHARRRAAYVDVRAHQCHVPVSDGTRQ
jgi:alanine dehydrogenase